jgi:nicotinate-nucleotide adenylyltransferase
LLGGSFDPAHEGHRHISRIALNRLGLNRVWWLVSPGNPLKPDAPAPLDRRMDAARAILDGHPRIIPTDIERDLGTVYTVDTIHALQRRHPRTRFVWLMGADNLVQFRHWHRWEAIMHALPIAVMARPGEQIRAGLSTAARRFAAFRLPDHEADALPYCTPPCWTMLTHPTSPLSSTSIRAKGGWQ